MIRLRKRIYIDSQKGLCNRLETYVLAYAMRQEFGHEIILGWPERDALQIEGTRWGYPGLWGRLGALRLRHCRPELYQTLGRHRKIILRDYDGPPEKLAAIYKDATSKISLQSQFCELVRTLFRIIGDKPVVGVHLRRADFPLFSEDTYDLRRQSPLSGVPVWWHEWVMERIVRREPKTCFLVCHNGDAEGLSRLQRNFDVVEVSLANPYLAGAQRYLAYKARYHPVADLFALACCHVMLATPVSSYSHYAANVLGGPSVCLVPPFHMTREAPAVARVRAYGQILLEWFNATALGRGLEALDDRLDGIDFEEPPRLDWLGQG